MKKFITLSFLPSFPDFGLLVVRLWAGLSLLLIHGVDKIKHHSDIVTGMGQGGIPSYLAYCAIAAESVGAALVAIGLATRWAALAVGTTMSVAFFKVHQAVLIPAKPGDMTGELAFLYLGFFAAIVLAGPGRWSVDRAISKS